MVRDGHWSLVVSGGQERSVVVRRKSHRHSSSSAPIHPVPSHLILVLQAEVAELVELLIGPALHEEPQVVLDEVHGEGRRGGRGGGAGRGQGGAAGQGETIRVPAEQAAGER